LGRAIGGSRGAADLGGEPGAVVGRRKSIPINPKIRDALMR
jgi:hypothetical protein